MINANQNGHVKAINNEYTVVIMNNAIVANIATIGVFERNIAFANKRL